MTHRTCEICGLKSKRKGTEKRFFMAKFPLDESRCRKWVQITGKEDLAYIPIEKLHDNKYICGKHFTDKQFKKKKTQLKKTAVPSLKLSNKPLSDDIMKGFPYHIHSMNKVAALDNPDTSNITDTNKTDPTVLQTAVLDIPETTNFTDTTIVTDPTEPYLTETSALFIPDNPNDIILIVTDSMEGFPETAALDLTKISNVTDAITNDSTMSECITETDAYDPLEISDIAEEVITETTATDIPGTSNIDETRQRETRIEKLYLMPRKPKLVRKLKRRKLTFEEFRQRAKMLDNIKYKTLKALFLAAKRDQEHRPQGRRWSDNLQSLALSMYLKCPKMYRHTRQFIHLPSRRTLKGILQKMRMEPGINQPVLNHLTQASKKINEKERICVLLFAEMSLKKKLIYNSANDKVEGFQDLGAHGRTNDIADHALVFMIQGLYKKYKQTIAYYFVKWTIATEKLVVLITETIAAVSECGFTVIATVCDQGPTNFNAINLLKRNSGFPIESNKFLVKGNLIHIIFDVPSLFRSIRNVFFQAGQLSFMGQKAKWSHLLEFSEINNTTLHFKKISPLHVNPTYRANKKVILAAQILSNTVAGILKLLSEMPNYRYEQEIDGTLKRDAFFQTGSVITQLDLLFDCTNGPGSKNDVKKDIRTNVSRSSNHHELWPEFKKKIKTMALLKSDSQLRLRNIRCINGYYTTLCSFQDIWRYTQEKGFKFLNLRQLNHDALENLFDLIRQHGPKNEKPTCRHFAAVLKSTIINRLSTPVKGGNCEEDNNTLLFDLNDLVFNTSEMGDAVQNEHECVTSSTL